MTSSDLPSAPRTAWSLTPGSAGHEVQCRGIIEALGIEPVLKRVSPSPPWSWLAPWGPAQPNPSIAPPWPDLVVVSGRQAIPYARHIRRASRARTFVLALQNPVVPPSQFDLVWVNEHDGISGPNVVRTLTSPNTLTPARLVEGAARFSPLWQSLPRPWIGVIVGGASGAYRFETADAERLGKALAALARTTGGSVIVTPSRRTGAAPLAALKAALAGTPSWVWDLETGENPYFGILGAADRFIVTCDSVNMLGEAAFTGKPIHAWRLEGGSSKFKAFHDGMIASGAMRWLDWPPAGAPESASQEQSSSVALAAWTYHPLNANAVVVDAVRRAFAERAGRRGAAA